MRDGQIFYIGDSHFSHRGILNSRPQFTSIQEMDDALLTAWRSRVRPNDTVYIVGDLFGFRANIDILENLTGQLVLVCGNHEETWLPHVEPNRYFSRVCDTAKITDDGRTVAMCHWPRPDLYPKEEDGWLLHGHLHGTPPRREDWIDLCRQPRTLNVGADIAMFTGILAPATLDEWIFFNEVWRDEMSR